MKWWRLALGGGLLLWVLATAYRRARARDRELGLAVLLLGGAALMFVAAALVPRPPMTGSLATVFLVGCVVSLAGAVAVVLAKGFRD